MMLMTVLALASCTNSKQLNDDKVYDVYVDDELVFSKITTYYDYKWTDEYFCLEYTYGEYYQCYFSDDIEVKTHDTVWE